MKINFIGDIYLANSVKIDKSLNLSNIVLNLEAPFTNNGEPAKNKINLFMDKKNFLETFKKNEILAVNIANNHIMDYGEEAFQYTIGVLKDNDIPYFGAGNLSNNFNNPLIIDDKIAFFGYSCQTTNGVFGNKTNNGSALFDLKRVIDEIGKYKKNYYIIVSIHWGQEYFSFPRPEDVEKARDLINAGVDLILGHHPHNIQSYEIYKDKYIFYSLGNGVFHDSVVPSKYDGSKFTRNYKMKYSKSNRISLRVILDTGSNTICKQLLLYNQKTLFSYSSLYLRCRIRILLSKNFYRIYSFYKIIIFRIKYHIKKLTTGCHL